MSEKPKYRLCGGTFFTLLLQSVKAKKSYRSRLRGETDQLSEPGVLLGFIKVIFPNHPTPSPDSFKTIISNYKSCKISNSEHLPFENDILIGTFEREVKEDYLCVLRRLDVFIDQYLDKVKLRWLLNALLFTIDSDEFIDENALFYIDKSYITKKDLLNSSELYIQQAIIGIWLYILKSGIKNTDGADTYNQWHETDPKYDRKRIFCLKLTDEWNRDVNFYEFQNEEETQKKSSLPGIVLAENLINTNYAEALAKYVEASSQKYGSMKTIIYREEARPFYEFYVCNDVVKTVVINNRRQELHRMKNITIESLRKKSQFIIITGTGGLGKSMMMRHLFLSSLKDYNAANRIPIYIQLKDYEKNDKDILDFARKKFNSICIDTSSVNIDDLLICGRCILLFDGYDEISTDARDKFDTDFVEFADKYSKNMFIMSSRPVGNFLAFDRFTVLELCPLDQLQAVSLIEKLDFRIDEPEIKEKFLWELKHGLFYSHRSFSENPLLLNIMLLTFEEYAEIPSKMHIFYREAYYSLAKRHDANKGGFSRKLKTGLTADRFADVFMEFCARTYHDEKFEFTDIQFEDYFNSLKAVTEHQVAFSHEDFKYDLVNNMCLMFYEGRKYHFVHRSFQEYFCALYFSKQKDKALYAIGQFFENKNKRNRSDKTFDMLYDMIPEKIDEYIFLPFLTKMFDGFTSEHGYWSFVIHLYPYIGYEKGSVNSWAVNESSSFLYNFIGNNHNLIQEIESDCFPDDLDFFREDEFCDTPPELYPMGYESGTMLVSDLPSDYFKYNEFLDIVGYGYWVDTEEVYKDPRRYQRLYTVFESETFPLKKEYDLFLKFIEKLKRQQTITGDNLFDLF